MKPKVIFSVLAALALFVSACDIGGVDSLIDRLKAIGGGAQAQGVVVGLGDNSLSVLIQQAGDSSYTVGNISEFTIDGDSTFAYVGGVAAGFVSLELGQHVKIKTPKDAAFRVSSMELMNTDLHGVVESINEGMNEFTMTATIAQGVDVGTIAGFGNPVTVRFATALPSGLSVGADADVRGVFNRTAPDIFDAVDSAAEVTGSMQAANFGLESVSPLEITITGDGGGLGLANPATVKVVLGTSVAMVERTAGVDTSITATQLAAGILDDRYASLFVEGSYDAATNTLTASALRANVG
ncbi:MAG: hypothetical protein IT462_10660 [Planctomycetes bacterium]|nr:hypothetical protein [Planctomycetota bacterium]